MFKIINIVLALTFCVNSFGQVKVGADGAIHATGAYPATSLREAKAYALTVQGMADRNAIPANYRDTGMMVLVRDSGYIYSLVGGILNANWTLCALAASPSNAQNHTAGYGLLGSPYNTNSPVTWVVDTSIIAPISIINTITGSDTVTYIVDSIANAPTGSEPNNTQYLVGTSPTGTFASHANQVAKLIGGVWNYTTPTSQQQLIVDNAVNYASYQYSGIYPTGVWKQTSILVRVGGNKTGASLPIGTRDNKVVIFKVNNHEVYRITLDSTFQYTKFKGQDSSHVYFTVDSTGKQVLGHFVPEIIYVDSVTVVGDSLIVLKDGRRNAYLVGGSGGSETWEQTLQNQGSTPFTTDNYVDLGTHTFALQNGLVHLDANGGDNTFDFNNDGLSTDITTVHGSNTYNVNNITSDSTLLFDVNRSFSTTTIRSKLQITPELISIYGQNNADTTNVNLKIRVDSSNADPNNMLYIGADGFVHRGHVSGGGSGITALTGDVTASGTGSVAATLATVNSNVGSFTNANITVNAKGLITAASNGSSGSFSGLKQTITATAAQTAFSFTLINSNASFSRNGQLLSPTLDYTVSGNTLTMVAGLDNGDIVQEFGVQ